MPIKDAYDYIPTTSLESRLRSSGLSAFALPQDYLELPILWGTVEISPCTVCVRATVIIKHPTLSLLTTRVNAVPKSKVLSSAIEVCPQPQHQQHEEQHDS